MRRTDLVPIRRARLLSAVPEVELVRMLGPSLVQSLPEGAVLCRQGEKPEFLNVVVAGRVGLFGEHGPDEALIEVFGPGDACIVPAVVLDMPALLTARMLEEGRILMWPAVAFRDQVQSNGALAYGAMLQLAGYWRMLISQLKDLKLLSATERLSNLLLSLAPRGRGPVRVTLPGNRLLIAGLLGVAPQSLSRAFAALRPLGVTGGGREIAIADTTCLRDLAGGRALKITPTTRRKGRKTARSRRTSARE